MTLRFDIVRDDVATIIQLHTRDLILSALPRSHTRQKEQVPTLRACGYGPTGSGAFDECVISFLFTSTHQISYSTHHISDTHRPMKRDLVYDSFTQTFFGSVKKRKASKPPSFPRPECFIPPNGVRKSRNIQQLIQTIPDWILLATR